MRRDAQIPPSPQIYVYVLKFRFYFLIITTYPIEVIMSDI